MIGNTILLALREIRRNVLRSFLTILGIVIGVGAVITMVTIGGGATLQVQQQIASMGSNLLMLSPGKRMGPGRPPGLVLQGGRRPGHRRGNQRHRRCRPPIHELAQGDLGEPELVHQRGGDGQSVPSDQQPGPADRKNVQRRGTAGRRRGLHHRGHREKEAFRRPGPHGRTGPPPKLLL